MVRPVGDESCVVAREKSSKGDRPMRRAVGRVGSLWQELWRAPSTDNRPSYASWLRQGGKGESTRACHPT